MPPLIGTASPVALRPATGLPAFALLISCWKRVFDCCVWAKQPRAGDTQRRARIAVLIVCMIASFCSCCFFDNKSTKNIRVTTRSHPLFCKSKGSDGQSKGSKRQSKGSKGQSKQRQSKGSKRQSMGSDGQSKGSKRQNKGSKGSCRPAVTLLQLPQICGKNFWGIFAPASRHPAVTAPTCPLRWR